MNRPAAISGSLIDLKNVNCHKVMRMTIDVPVEMAADVIAAFGWPTAVSPVSVAIARLETEPRPALEKIAEALREKAAAERAAAPPTRRTWADLSPAQQAGIRCNEQSFQEFISRKFGYNDDPAGAAIGVRYHCHVESRAQIIPGSTAADRWQQLDMEYRQSFWPEDAS